MATFPVASDRQASNCGGVDAIQKRIEDSSIDGTAWSMR
jgi:hypothetical protein